MPSLTEMVNALLGKAEPPPINHAASVPTHYPTNEDVDFARKYDYSYGQPWARNFEGKEYTIPAAQTNSLKMPMESQTVSVDKFTPKLPPDVKNYYAKAALAVQNSPLAQLGFNPGKSVVDLERPLLSTGPVGKYNRTHDQIYASAAQPSTIVHESIHRGRKLLEESPYWDKKFDPISDELATRWLMRKKMGNPELDESFAFSQALKKQFSDEELKKMGVTYPGAKEMEHAAFSFDPKLGGPLSREKNDLLEAMEAAAAQYIANKHPGGPR